MNRPNLHKQVSEYLISEGASEDTFSIGEPLGDNRHNLVEEGGLWKVFFFERGSRSDAQEFESHADAMDEFCRRVLVDSSNR